jgi:hypothetical protein
MRCALLLSVLVLAVVPSASAQASFGLSVGLNTSNAAIEEFNVVGVDKQPRLGLTAGVIAEIPLLASLSLHPELNYSQQGYTIVYSEGEEGGTEFQDGSFTEKVDYFQLPVFLAYHIRGANGLNVAIEAGPYVAFKLADGLSCNGDVEPLCQDEGERDTFRSLDVGMGAGGVVAAGPYGFGLRYVNGITAANIRDFRNQAFSVFAHYRFGK